MDDEVKLSNGMHEIPNSNVPMPYIDGLVYYKLDMRVAGAANGGGRLIHYVSDRRDRPGENDVQAFLQREIIGHGQEFAPGLGANAKQALDVRLLPLDFRIAGQPTPYDLHISRGCLLVIHLADRWNWQFQSNHWAVTTKKPQGDKNCNLVHLEADGSTIAGLPSAAHPARYAYFTVARRADHEDDHQVNIHVEFDTRQVDILDPDIKNDGNQIPPPSPPPPPGGPPEQ